MRQPWAWAFFGAGKDIENRNWNTNYRGLLLIHAAARATEADQVRACRLMARKPLPDAPHRSALLGVVRLNGVHGFERCGGRCSRWAMDSAYHWEVSEPVAFGEPLAAAGAQKLWRPDDALNLRVQRLLAELRS